MLSSNLRGWVVLSACRYCEMAWGYGVFNLELHSAAISCWKGTTVVEQLVSLDHGEMFCRVTSLHQQLAGGRNNEEQWSYQDD